MKITAIEPGRTNRRLMNVYLEGKRAFNLVAGTVNRAGLLVGKELSADEIEILKQDDQQQRCLDVAMHLLSYRPRSQFELRNKLQQKGFSSENIHSVMERLKEQRLINDTEFAQFWKETRASFRPRSQRLIKLELRQKKVPEDIIEEVASEINDDELAYQVALTKAAKLYQANEGQFRLRLGEHLRRRGFSYEVARRAADKVWQESRGYKTPRLPQDSEVKR